MFIFLFLFFLYGKDSTKVNACQTDNFYEGIDEVYRGVQCCDDSISTSSLIGPFRLFKAVTP